MLIDLTNPRFFRAVELELSYRYSDPEDRKQATKEMITSIIQTLELSESDVPEIKSNNPFDRRYNIFFRNERVDLREEFDSL